MLIKSIKWSDLLSNYQTGFFITDFLSTSVFVSPVVDQPNGKQGFLSPTEKLSMNHLFKRKSYPAPMPWLYVRKDSEGLCTFVYSPLFRKGFRREWGKVRLCGIQRFYASCSQRATTSYSDINCPSDAWLSWAL